MGKVMAGSRSVLGLFIEIIFMYLESFTELFEYFFFFFFLRLCQIRLTVIFRKQYSMVNL